MRLLIFAQHYSVYRESSVTTSRITAVRQRFRGLFLRFTARLQSLPAAQRPGSSYCQQTLLSGERVLDIASAAGAYMRYYRNYSVLPSTRLRRIYQVAGIRLPAVLL